MGIYTSNRYFGEAYDYAAEIPANEAYDAAFGCAHILADCQANDMALFESSIYSDMQEVMAVQEGYQVVNENAFSNVIKKIVEMFKKLLAKIKGIFNAFLAKLAGAFKNGKQLVKQYEKQIIKYSNWKDLKIKRIRKPKSDKKDIRNALSQLFTFEIKTAYKLPDSVTKTTDAENLPFTGVTGFETAKKIKDGDAEDIKTALISEKYVNFKVSDYKDIDNEIKEKLYDDEDTLDGEDDIKTASFFSESWIKSVLSDDKWENDIQKDANRMEKVINKIIDDLNKVDDNLAKHMSSNNDTAGTIANLHGRSFGQSGEIKKDTSIRDSDTDVSASDKFGTTNVKADTAKSINEKFQVFIHALQTLASNEQEVITKVTSLYMENIKFATAQARKIWTAAAAWSSTTHKESVEYYQALGEAAAEQFYSNMETIGA
jgi:hypothetical protein